MEHMEAVLRSLKHRLEITRGELIIRDSDSNDPMHGFDQAEVDQVIQDLFPIALKEYQDTHPKTT